LGARKFGITPRHSAARGAPRSGGGPKAFAPARQVGRIAYGPIGGAPGPAAHCPTLVDRIYPTAGLVPRMVHLRPVATCSPNFDHAGHV